MSTSSQDQSAAPPRNYDIPALKRMDAAHHWHPFTDTKALEEEGGTRVITRAEGCYLYDGDGNKILDGMAGLWCVNVGYGRTELAEIAHQQMLELPYYNNFFKTASPPPIELAERISGLLGDGFNKVFFSNSGSEANDTIFRMVRHYWNLMGKPKKKTFISRWNAYHGSTVAGVSLGGMKPMHKQADLPVPGVTHVMQPYWFDEAGPDESEDAFGLRAAAAIEDRILELGPETIAAFIGEPIQGAGGVIIPPDTYWPEVERICRKYDILLIADEVICGFGRTGEWFGHQSMGFQPDLIPMAKGMSSGYLPISGVAVHDRVAETVINEGGEFYHGYTYSGHPVAAAVALRNIDILEREGLVEKVATRTGPYLAEALHRLTDHPLVGQVRSRGLIAGVEICRNKETRERFEKVGEVGTICRDHIFARNAIARACGDTMVMSPPLIIDEVEIDALISALEQALDATYADVKHR